VILDRFRTVTASHDIVLVEGAGGLLVPIWERYTMADLAGDVGLPLLVVAASRLGAVNHTLLTLEHARFRGLLVAAYVLNQLTDAVDDAMSTNAELLARSTDVPCAGVIEWSPSDSERRVEGAAEAVRRSVSLEGLLGTGGIASLL
jgi:dethiobiotin synthetase